MITGRWILVVGGLFFNTVGIFKSLRDDAAPDKLISGMPLSCQFHWCADSGAEANTIYHWVVAQFLWEKGKWIWQTVCTVPADKLQSIFAYMQSNLEYMVDIPGKMDNKRRDKVQTWSNEAQIWHFPGELWNTALLV